jgi:hypothetical protein
MSALGQKRTYALQQAMSALPPIATAKADMAQMVMSALAPKADMCLLNLPRSGPSKAWLKIKNPKAPAAIRAVDGTF